MSTTETVAPCTAIIRLVRLGPQDECVMADAALPAALLWAPRRGTGSAGDRETGRA
ncbi:hypothetical protein [Streptomyces sp. FIT100]|uniref:hypothetical protein n=1 Tax=Streptomyces sp. FIT100 TaxID=2837956 RepID=UPI0021C98BA0|nr:hypothetical protein [Streptomyces sp. FIT100]UUN30933.1 hypothetical protein KK483_34850 [Streptomyces sp. FIT100]